MTQATFSKIVRGLEDAVEIAQGRADPVSYRVHTFGVSEMTPKKDGSPQTPSAKSIGANESNTSLKKLMKMGANPTLVAKGQGVRQP